MSKGRNKGTGSHSSGAKRGGAAAGATVASSVASPSRARLYLAIVAGVAALLVVAAVGFVVLGQPGSGSSSSQAAGQTSGQTAGQTIVPGNGGQAAGQTIVPGNGGHWTNVTPDRLAQMLAHKDFTLVNVKTPYIGEIQGTDLYIPYDKLGARAGELPANKTAKILVYCRSGVQSAQAAQTLLDLGYANVWNLDGGMNAWQASGRTLVNLNR